MRKRLDPYLQVSKNLLGHIQFSEAVVLVGLALVVGLLSGIGVLAFKTLIDIVTEFAFGKVVPALAHWGTWTIALLPVGGGLVVGLLLHFFIGEERHHGVAGIMEAVALAGGRLRYQRIPAKAVAAAISIGSGASVGPEDPSVQIGSNLGSMIGQWLRLSDERKRSLVAAGAASGIAAAFNAPIAGVFFALEIILGEIGGRSLGVVVIAAVISAVFTQATSGAQPAFHVPEYAFGSAWELPIYLALGLLAGPISALYVRTLYRTQDIFHHLQKIPRWLKPAAAGLLVGIAGIFLPQIFGVGYETIEKILAGEYFSLSLLAALLLAKLIFTSVSIAGGFPGGVFAPSLFIGAMLGSAFGNIADGLFPSLNITPPAFAMVGMAAVLAGAVHSPLTAIILLFEMTNDYRIILPLMFSVIVSMLISQSIQHDSVYTLGLARKGIRLSNGRDVEVLEAIKVSEIMQTSPVTIRENDTLQKAAEILTATRHHGAPVVNATGALIGIFTVSDLDRFSGKNWSELTAGEKCTRDLIVAFPDETIGTALRKMGARDIGRLPVVEHENQRIMVGLLRRTDLVRAYTIALTRRATMRHRAHQIRLDATTQTEVNVVEIPIKEGAICAGKRVGEVQWPHDCILSSVQRGRRVFIPRGDTILHTGDILVAVTENDADQELLQLCQKGVEAHAGAE